MAKNKKKYMLMQGIDEQVGVSRTWTSLVLLFLAILFLPPGDLSFAFLCIQSSRIWVYDFLFVYIGLKRS